MKCGRPGPSRTWHTHERKSRSGGNCCDPAGVGKWDGMGMLLGAGIATHVCEVGLRGEEEEGWHGWAGTLTHHCEAHGGTCI